MMEMITTSKEVERRNEEDLVSKKLGTDLVLEEDNDNDSLRTSTTQDTTTAEGRMLYGYHLPIQQERDITLNFGQDFRQQSSSSSRCSTCTKLGVLLAVTAFFIWIIVDSSDLEHAVEVFFQWVERNPGIGCVAFIGVCYLCTLLFLPVSILASGGGFVFAHSFGIWIGVLLATLAVFVGAGLGALTAFLSGRYLMRQTAQSLKEKYPILEAIDSGGTSSMAALTYAWTLLAILPGTIVYTFLGATASSLTLHQHPGTSASLWEIVSIVVGITLGTIGIATMSYYAKQELRKITLQREAIAALENELI